MVVLESAFSIGGRMINPYRSRLRSDTVKNFTCGQNWLCTNIKDINVVYELCGNYIYILIN
jgi:hypothetical protein